MSSYNIRFTERRLEDIRYDKNIGFSNIPDQVRWQSINTGFNLNILIVGRRGLGSQTLINSIFRSPILSKTRENTVFETQSEIVENNIKLTLNIISYHGNSIDDIISTINEMNLDYFFDEQSIKGAGIDRRVHACIYMLPTDDLLGDEIAFITKLSSHCNLLPVISKSDTYTTQELLDKKSRLQEIFKNIDLFKLDISSENNIEDEAAVKINEALPLAITGGELIPGEGTNTESYRGRVYKWGSVNIEDENICDFLKLRRIFMCFLDELVDKTTQKYYSQFLSNHCQNGTFDHKMKSAKNAQLVREMELIIKEKYDQLEQDLIDRIQENNRLINNSLGEREVDEVVN